MYPKRLRLSWEVDECKPLGGGEVRVRVRARDDRQGLTLIHFSAQRKQFLWDRGYI